MTDADWYFPPRPASVRREPDSRVARQPAVVREELAGGCALYRPLRFARMPRQAGTPGATGRSLREAPGRP